jgi:hypothetical protein
VAGLDAGPLQVVRGAGAAAGLIPVPLIRLEMTGDASAVPADTPLR